MARSIEAPETPNGRLNADLDRRLAAQTCALVAALQRRGLVRVGIEAGPLGELVFNVVNMLFIEFVRDEGMGLDGLRARLAVQLGPLARLVAP